MNDGSVPVYRIHPGIGVARLGNSPDAIAISPERPAGLPIDCDEHGNPLLSTDGTAELPVKSFKDAEGRIKRQAARFRIYVHDEQSPEGRPLELGDPVSGGGNDGVLVDIQWRVHLANKKAGWYRFEGSKGEHGYDASHPRRNADITGDNARQRLIIDPGPHVVNATTLRKASFDRAESALYAPVFPPPLSPCSIDTLGDMLTDDRGRLLVLGGHGNSGSFKTGFGQPRIDSYANTDGWFDDTSDGPVMARLVIYSKEVGKRRFIDVEYPAWVLVGYPSYVPEILDLVTLDDVVQDLAIRELASRTDLYGKSGTFASPQQVDASDVAALSFWKAGAMDWNADYKPWFFRDVWPILFRVDEMSYLTNILQQSNFPHNQSARGNFDPDKLGVPPVTNQLVAARLELDAAERNQSGELLVEAIESVLLLLDPGRAGAGRARAARTSTSLTEPAMFVSSGDHRDDAIRDSLRAAAARFASLVTPQGVEGNAGAYLQIWLTTAPGLGESEEARALKHDVAQLTARLVDQQNPRAARARSLRARRDEAGDKASASGPLEDLAVRQLDAFLSGRMLQEAFHKAVESATLDYYLKFRTYLHDVLRRPGEENAFRLGGRPHNRTFNLPLMPLLCGDNPITNELPSKFLRLTDYQLFILRQWSRGKFINEVSAGWIAAADPFEPYASWVNATAQDLDRGVLTNLLGGAFCPGGEVSWIIRNPSAYKAPYRLKADPDYCAFRQTAAQASASSAELPLSEQTYVSDLDTVLSQDTDLDRGLQPGDLTKYSGLPWQADFNECSTQTIDITYDEWNAIDPESQNDPLMKAQEKVWETLWWPAHRPLQTYEVVGMDDGSPVLAYLSWSRGVPQTYAGDLKMVTEWSRLGFVVRNPYVAEKDLDQASPDQKYISVERTREKT